MTKKNENARSEAGAKYRAFISYSHRDKRWGDWLHKALETYRVPRRLVGTESRDGAVPKRLFPVFRDREELPGSPDLGQNITEALDASLYMVVICSPRSADSLWVNEEIKYFKSLGREHRVLCIIVEGEPNATDKSDSGLAECFPEAVRYRVASDGHVTDERSEPIAADARPDGDGRHNARLKLLAGLLGVDYDNLRQRERIRRRQRRTIQAAAAAVLLAGVGISWQFIEQARFEQRLESSRRLAQEALEATRKGQPHKGLQLALEAIPATPEETDSRAAPLAYAALHRTFTANRLIGRLTGHTAAPHTLSYSENGDRLLSTDPSNEVSHLWNTETRELVAPMKPSFGGHTAHLIDDDLRILLYNHPSSSFQKHHIEIRDASSGERLTGYTFDTIDAEDDSGVTSSEFRPITRLLLGEPYTRIGLVRRNDSGREHVIVIDAQSGRTVKQFPPEAGAINTIAFLPDRRILVAHAQGLTIYGSDDRRLMAPRFDFWPRDGAELVAIDPDPSGRYLALQFRLTGAESAAEGKATLKMLGFDLNGGTELWHTEFEAPNWLEADVLFSPDGDRFYVGLLDDYLEIDLSRGQKTGQWKRGILTVAGDPLRRAWSFADTLGIDYPHERFSTSWSAHPSGVNSMAMAPSNGPIATADDDAVIRLWDNRSGTLGFASIPGTPAGSLIQPRGGFVWHDEQGGLFRGNGTGSDATRMGTSHFAPNASLRWFAGRSALLQIDKQGQRVPHPKRIRLRAYPEGQVVFESPVIPGRHDIEIDPDRRVVAYPTKKDEIRLVRMSGGEPSTSTVTLRPTQDGKSRQIVDFALSPGGQRIAAATWSDGFMVGSTGTGEITETFAPLADTGNVMDAAFSPDGSKLATLHYGSVLVLRHADDGRLITRFQSDALGNEVRFSRDATRLLTLDTDQVVAFWSLEGELLGRFNGITSTQRIETGPNGRFFLATGNSSRGPVTLAPTDLSEKKTLECGGSAARGGTWGPEGRRVVTFSGTNLCVYDIKAGTNIVEYANSSTRFHNAYLSGDGARIVSISNAGIRRWPLYNDRRELVESARRLSERIDAQFIDSDQQ